MGDKGSWDLVGRPVTFTFARPGRLGTYCAVVRGVKAGRRALTALIVTLHSDWHAASLSAKYRGERVRLEGRELELVVVHHRGRRWPLDEWLRRSPPGAEGAGQRRRGA